MWLEFFALFGIAWWCLFVLSSGLIIWSLEEENTLSATGVFFLTMLLWFFLGDLGATEEGQSIFDKFNWVFLLQSIAVYFVGGTFWAVFKWWRFAKNRLFKYEELRGEWLTTRGIEDNVMPGTLKEQWTNYVLERHQEYTKYTVDIHGMRKNKVIDIRVYAKNNKALIVTWMTYWPWNFTWFILDDLVKGIWNWIQRVIGNLLDRISTSVFSKAESDFVDPKE